MAVASAQNTYGVRTGTERQAPLVLDHTKTYHGISIQTNTGDIIGRVQGWNPQFAQRDGVLIYELNTQTWGRPIDFTPGKESGRQITCSRVETWFSEIETILGQSYDQGFPRQGYSNPFREFRDLCDQTVPFQVNEVWLRGRSRYRVWTYRGCWFGDKNQDEYQAEGDPTVRCNVTIHYVVRDQA